MYYLYPYQNQSSCFNSIFTKIKSDDARPVGLPQTLSQPIITEVKMSQGRHLNRSQHFYRLDVVVVEMDGLQVREANVADVQESAGVVVII